MLVDSTWRKACGSLLNFLRFFKTNYMENLEQSETSMKPMYPGMSIYLKMRIGTVHFQLNEEHCVNE